MMRITASAIAVVALLALVVAPASAGTNVGARLKIVIPEADGTTGEPTDVLVNVPTFDVKGTYEVQSVNGAGNQITLKSAPTGITAGQCYIRMQDGNAAGFWATITGVAGATVTLDLTKGNFLDGSTVAGITVDADDTLTIVEHATFDKVFPAAQAGRMFVKTTSTLPTQRKTQVIVPAQADVTNQSGAETFYYLQSGTRVGWRSNLGGINVDKGAAVIDPDSYLIIRNNADQKLFYVVAGTTNSGVVGRFVTTKTVEYDINFSSSRPTAVTLNDLNLLPVFKKTTSTLPTQRQDLLLVFDNTAQQSNKAAAEQFYYLESGTRVGWRSNLTGINVDRGDTLVDPAAALVIRKKATTGSDIPQAYQQSSPIEE